MSDEHHSGLLYGLEQRIPPLPAFFSALQHVLAGLVGIITPPLIIGATLGLGDWLPYLISMSLLASGHQFCLPRRDGGRRDVGKSPGRRAAGYDGDAVWR